MLGILITMVLIGQIASSTGAAKNIDSYGEAVIQKELKSKSFSASTIILGVVMFKIGEFSKLTQVTVRMLRYYDEAGLLKPAYIDKWSGYRMYSVEQIPVLNRIIYLRDSGFNVSEIAEALSDKHNAAIIDRLDKKYDEIQSTIESEQLKLEKIELAKKELMQGGSQMHLNVSIKPVPSYEVLSFRKVIPNYYAEGEMWQELSEFVRENKLMITDETFSVYHDEEYKEKDVDVELCAVVKKSGKSTEKFIFKNTEPLPAVASTMVYGEFSNIAEVYLEFAKWLSVNSQYKMQAQSRQIVHRGPWNEEDPQKYLVEIQIPLDKFS